jgi:protein ImuB
MDARKKTDPLWLSLHFPHLALDELTRGLDTCSELPVAVSDPDARGPRILDCNPAAARAGVRPGLTVNAALALAGSLHLAPRDSAAEQAALRRMAAWCYQYSSRVTIVPQRHALVLEAGASQCLFGDPEALAERLYGELSRLGYHPHAGTAPTPEAAHLAARHGLHITPHQGIRAQIGGLPVASLHLEPSRVAALRKMGFRTLGEILRLPRKALARRMGTATVDYLDRLTGCRPDPQTPWHPPTRFSSGMDLSDEATESRGLIFPLRRLVHELCGVLRACDRGIQELDIHLRLDRPLRGRDEMHLRLGLQQPTRDEPRIQLLLRERLERTQLPRPVRHIRLSAARFLAFDAEQDTLFRDHPDCGPTSARPLLERLEARLGAGAVTGLRGVQDHRPEHSWTARKLDEPADCTAMPHRPLWLFASPQRCHIADYQVLAGPERIEAGWWDGHDCRRDYFVVRDRTGCTLWAFREYKPGSGWYLQGMFA